MSTKRFPSEEARLRAQGKAEKAEQRRQDAVNALAAHQAEQQAVAEKTARLRALRLAKEAADAEEAAKNPPPPKKAAKPRVRRAAVRQ
jgi:alkylation response protein AidB-like acyl-CoA dehydrogenase